METAATNRKLYRYAGEGVRTPYDRYVMSERFETFQQRHPDCLYQTL